MEMDAYAPGVPSWVDVMTHDLPTAIAFYSALFGWDIEQGPPEAGGYSIAHLRGRAVAGLMPQMDDMPPVWATYVNVENADATTAKVEPAGGKLFVAPMDVMDVGRMSVFADPFGAVIGVWQPGTHKGAGIIKEPGTLRWNELVTTDVEGSKPFYASVFGWDAITHGGTGPEGYTEFQLGGESIAGMMAKPPGTPAEMPPFWGVYFDVADTDATIERITELGGTIIVPARDVEPGRIAVALDPTGAAFSIMQMK